MEDTEMLVTLTADIVAAHVSNNSVAISDIPLVIRSVHEALAGLTANAEPEPEPQQPAVSIRSSVKPDYIVCLEDGKKLKMLRRHLMTHYGMTPEDYRAVRRQNIWHNSRRKLAECGPRQGLDFKRRACGVASADIRWSVV